MALDKIPGRCIRQWNNHGVAGSLTTEEGRTYWLERRDSLDEGEWTTVHSVAGDGFIRVLSDAAAGGGKRFYRVRVE